MNDKKLRRKLRRKEQALYSAGNKYIKNHWSGNRGAYYVMQEFGADACKDAKFYFCHQSGTFVEGYILYDDGYCYTGPIYPPDYFDNTIKYFVNELSKLYDELFYLGCN